MLTARELTPADEAAVLDFVREIEAFDGNFEGLRNFQNMTDYGAFLASRARWKRQELLEPPLVAQITFGVFEGPRLVGGFNLRPKINGVLLRRGGHVGYLIRPSERGRGRGTALLGLALERAKALGLDRVLVTCRAENAASARVIEKNGGVYENSVFDPLDQTTLKRYWITIKEESRMKEVIFAKDAPAAVGPYSHAIASGALVFLSGQVPLVPETGVLAEGGIEGQARQMFANIQAVLEASGLTFDNVVKTTVFMTDLKDFNTFNDIYAEYFPKEPPGRSCVQVAALPKGALVECECVCVK